MDILFMSGASGQQVVDSTSVQSPGSSIATVAAQKERGAQDSLKPHNVVYVDLRDHFDEDLLKRFYYDLMVPNFPFSDELDSIEYMQYMLLQPKVEEEENESKNERPAELDFHTLIMISLPSPPKPNEIPNYKEGTIMGGVVFEYYRQANVGLLTYLLVSSKYRGLRLGYVLSEACHKSLEVNAKSRGHLAGCNVIFLETNSALKVHANADVMPPAERHQIFYKMGLRLVDFDYIQAPLASDKKKVNYLLLCCFINDRIPSVKIGNEVSYYLPSTLLRSTIRAFWANAPLKGKKYTEDVDFKRMNDQLTRRERIFLLDLPWERPFTVVDLHEHFDLELLVTFYQDLLMPCYRGRESEMDSLDSWLELLSPKSQKSFVSDVPSMVGTVAASPVVEFHLILALKYSEDEEENSKPMIAGGLAFEYYPGNNCGFLTYLIVPIGDRGERMARALIDAALEELDTAAKRRGQLGGCNVIFMESRTGPLQNSSTTEFQDIEQQHPILEAMGWKMLDFDYVPPPNLDPAKKIKQMFLMVLVTPRIPMLLQEELKNSYLPRSTLKKFLMDMWDVACAARFSSYDYQSDRDFMDMIDQLERRPRIPLLPRPWSKPWTLFDLQEGGNTHLMTQFYTELLAPNYSLKDDLEPLELFQRKLSSATHSAAQIIPEIVHILVAVKPIAVNSPPQESSPSDSNAPPGAVVPHQESVPRVLLGGLVIKYFETTNCGFITHASLRNFDNLAESDRPNTLLLARALFDRAVDVLDQDAVARGNLAGCNAIFLETADPTQADTLIKTQSTAISVDLSLQHSALHKLGWRLVDFTYIAPPPRAGRKPITQRSLALFVTSRIPRVNMPNSDDAYHYVPRAMLANFMKELWRLTCAAAGYDYDQDPEYMLMLDLLQRRERIPLLDLPWERPWTVVDLWEDFDAQLLYKFYRHFYELSLPNKAHREPLSKWLQLLNPEARDDPSIPDFHLLLALQFPNKYLHYPKASPNILGGVLFSYFTASNCGLLTYISLPNQSAELLARSLIEEATVNLNENAILRGHIAGCNAMFMEFPMQQLVGYNMSHELLYKMGWRLVSVAYYQPPVSIYSTGPQRYLLLALITPNIPKHQSTTDKVPTFQYFMPTDLLKNFILQHWKDAFARVGKSQVGKDSNFQSMMSTLRDLEQVTLLDLPWTTGDIVSANAAGSIQAKL